MPTIEELEQFKKNIDQLQDEPEYAAKRGWVIEDLSVPSSDEKLLPSADELVPPTADQTPLDDTDSTEPANSDNSDNTSLLDWSLEDGNDAEASETTVASADNAPPPRPIFDEGENSESIFTPTEDDNPSPIDEQLTVDPNATSDNNLAEDIIDNFNDQPNTDSTSSEEIASNNTPNKQDESQQSLDKADEELPASDSDLDAFNPAQIQAETPAIAAQEELIDGELLSDEPSPVAKPDSQLTTEDLEKQLNVNDLSGDSVADSEADSSKSLSTAAQIEQLEEQLYQLGGNNIDNDVNNTEQFRGNYFPLNPQNLAKFKQQIDNYPLNLRIAVENDIGNGHLPDEAVDTLVGLILAGASPKQLANRFFELSAKRVLLPKNVVMRLSQQEIQKRQQGFIHQFRLLALPWVRLYFLILVAFATLLMGFFYFFYRPLYSNWLYRQGEKSITIDRYKEAEHDFNQARYGWQLGSISVRGVESSSWYLRYAQAYRRRYNFIDAEAKYKAMLLDIPQQRQGWIDYASMLLKETHNYSQSIKLIRDYQSNFTRDQSSLLLLAQGYLAMANKNPIYYNEAYKNYRAAITTAGDNNDEVMLQMLRFLLIKTQRNPSKKNQKAIERLISLLLSKDEIRGANSATILSEIARHLIDQKQFQIANAMLHRSLELGKSNIDTYLQFSYYYRQLNEPSREAQALEAAIYFISNQKNNYTRQLQRFYIYNRLAALGQNKWYSKALQAANYAELRLSKRPSIALGELYSGVGNLLFEKEKFHNSRSYYWLAKGVNYQTPLINYRLGYDYYQHQDWDNSTKLFYQAQQGDPTSPKISYALANSLLQNEKWQSSAGIYLNVNQMLKQELESIPVSNLHLSKRRKILQIQLKSFNNMGASFYNQFLQTSEEGSLNQAMAAFTEAIVLQDALSRENETQIKLDKDSLELASPLPLRELDRLENEGSDDDLTLNSLPRKNFFKILHPEEKSAAEIYPLSSSDALSKIIP